MPHERYFIDQTLQEGQHVTLEDTEAHHLINVMRGKVGSKVELVNGKNYLGQALVIEIKKKCVELQIENVFVSKMMTTAIILAQAIPRLNRLDYIIEKGTELGMTSLWLFPADLSERKELSDSQLERAHKITIAAMKQCGRLDLPNIVILSKISKWDVKEGFQRFFGDVSDNAPTLSSRLKKNDASIFVIGPEAGLTENEEKELLKRGFEGVKLHQNTLRTDTAPLVALSLIHHFNL